jgi:hypothetical protein
MIATRAGMTRRVGIISAATAVRPPVPTCTTATSNLNDVVRRRTGQRERHRKRRRSGSETQSGSKNNREEFVHEMSCALPSLSIGTHKLPHRIIAR